MNIEMIISASIRSRSSSVRPDPADDALLVSADRPLRQGSDLVGPLPALWSVPARVA